MKKETKAFTFLIVHCIVMVTAIALSAYWLINSAPAVTLAQWLLKAKYIVEIIALLLGNVYFTVGYKKNAHMSYKCYMAFYGLSIMISIISIIMSEKIDLISLVITAALFATAIILAAAKDLGKKKSYSLGLELIIFSAALFVCMWLDKGFIDMELVYMNISGIMLATTTQLMIMGKYYDKELRGTK